MLSLYFFFHAYRENILHLIEEVFQGIMISLSKDEPPCLVYNGRRNWQDVRLVILYIKVYHQTMEMKIKTPSPSIWQSSAGFQLVECIV